MLFADLFAFAEAQLHLESALDLARSIHSVLWEYEVAGTLTSVLTREGRLEEAERLLQDEGFPTLPLTGLASRLVACARVELWLAQGQITEALDLCNRLRIHAGDGLPVRVGRLRAAAYVALGRLEEAKSDLRTVLAVAEAQDARAFVWRIRAELAGVLVLRSRSAEAVALRTAARSDIAALEEGLPAGSLRPGQIRHALTAVGGRTLCPRAVPRRPQPEVTARPRR